MQGQLVRVVTSRRRLDGLYGEGYFDNLLNVINSWKNALATDNIIVEESFVFCEDLPSDTLPQALKTRLARLNRKPADAVVILGGPDVVPFFPIDSPEFLVPIDGDTHVLSDDPYVAFDRHNVLYKPECPIGRLPDGGADDPALLFDLLKRAASYHWGDSSSTFAPLGLTSQLWHARSRQIFFKDSLYTCPPLGLPGHPCVQESSVPEKLQAHSLHYYNVCGARPNTVWYGQCDANGCQQKCDHPHVPLLDVHTIPPLPDAWIFSAASYSAHFACAENMALQFLRHGAISYVGTTSTTYCTSSFSSLGAGDQIAQAFVEGVRQNMQGHTQLGVGEILKRAKLGYRVQDNFDRKTLVEFVLLGDPTLIPFRT